MNASRRIEDLHPYMQPIVREVLRRAPKHGVYPFIMQGKRSIEYQACLWAQGRVAPGERLTVANDLIVTTEISGSDVIARCGRAENRVAKARWVKQVTWVLWSWHILGFAVDLGFRSAPDKLDHWIGELERERNWEKIEELYRTLEDVWAECVTGYVWGGTWAKRDLAHWEWHPGRTVEEVRAGILPPFPSQCSCCLKYPGALVTLARVEVCAECGDSLAVSRRRRGVRR